MKKQTHLHLGRLSKISWKLHYWVNYSFNMCLLLCCGWWNGVALLQVVPHCPRCPSDVPYAIMKPDIVFFGENLPELFHRAMKQDKDEVDLLIVIGSSLKVRPVALIPSTSHLLFFSVSAVIRGVTIHRYGSIYRYNLATFSSGWDSGSNSLRSRFEYVHAQMRFECVQMKNIVFQA